MGRTHVMHGIALATGIGLVLRPALGWSFSSPSADFLLCFSLVSLLYWMATMVAGGRRERGWSLSRGLGALARSLVVQLPGLVALASLLVGAGSVDALSLVGEQGAMPWQWRITDSPLSWLAFGLWVFGALARPESSEPMLGSGTRYRSRPWAARFLALTASLHWQLVCAFGVVAFLGGWRIPGANPQTVTLAAALLFLAKVALLGMLLEGVRRWFPPATPRTLLPAALRFALPLGLVVLFLGAEARLLRPHPLAAWLETGVPSLLIVLPFALLVLIVAWRRPAPDREGHAINPWL